MGNDILTAREPPEFEAIAIAVGEAAVKWLEECVAVAVGEMDNAVKVRVVPRVRFEIAVCIAISARSSADGSMFTVVSEKKRTRFLNSTT